jgi:hypothetical protein
MRRFGFDLASGTARRGQGGGGGAWGKGLTVAEKRGPERWIWFVDVSVVSSHS